MSAQPKIYEAIVGVMSEVGHIAKNHKNQGQGFNFRGIEDVYAALQPVMIKHGIFCSPEVLDADYAERATKSGSAVWVRLKVAYNFIASDGSCHRVVVQGEAMDSGDKATAKALSAAFKYCCFQTFCIPVAETPDPDAHTPEPSRPMAKGGLSVSGSHDGLPRIPAECSMALAEVTSRAGLEEVYRAWVTTARAEGWDKLLESAAKKRAAEFPAT